MWSEERVKPEDRFLTSSSLRSRILTVSRFVLKRLQALIHLLLHLVVLHRQLIDSDMPAKTFGALEICLKQA